MKAYGRYVSRFLISFMGVILLLLASNIVLFFWMFHHVVSTDYGETSPLRMLEQVSAVSTDGGIPEETAEELHRSRIWAMMISPEGKCLWRVDVPQEVPDSYTVQDVAVFSKGYLKDYPVFVWAGDTGLLVLGYPKNSFIKITGNYYSAGMLGVVPTFLAFTGVLDVTVIFLIYFLSKRKIIKSTQPIISSVEALSSGTPVNLSMKGELSSIAESVNRASRILSRQNEARANWISGVSHDIRTPLSMIMGYAARIAENKNAGREIREQAEIVRNQSIKIRELVQDLNLVSQLEYEMQPIHREPVRMARLLRSYTADLLNSGVPDRYKIGISVAPDAENAVLEGDARLITRAINNLVQNSMRHNPQGCEIRLSLAVSEGKLILAVADNGIGLSENTQNLLKQEPPYGKSTDERLGLRHGLGLRIVQQVAAAHNGSFQISNLHPHGCEAALRFPDWRLS